MTDWQARLQIDLGDDTILPTTDAPVMTPAVVTVTVTVPATPDAVMVAAVPDAIADIMVPHATR